MITNDLTTIEEAIVTITIDNNTVTYTRFNGEVVTKNIPLIVPDFNEQVQLSKKFVKNKPVYNVSSEAEASNTGSTYISNTGGILMNTVDGFKKIRRDSTELGSCIEFEKFKLGTYLAKGTIVYFNNSLFRVKISGIKYREPNIDSYSFKKLLHNNMFRIIKRSDDITLLGGIAFEDNSNYQFNVNSLFDLCFISDYSDDLLELKKYLYIDDGIFKSTGVPRSSNILVNFDIESSFSCQIEYTKILTKDYGGIKVLGYDVDNNILYENSIMVDNIGDSTLHYVEKHRESINDSFTIDNDINGLTSKTSSVLVQNSNVVKVSLEISYSSYDNKDVEISPLVSFSNIVIV